MTDDYADLERRFTHDLVDGVRVLAREIGYRAPLFSQMLTSLGGVETTRRLLRSPDAQYGFTLLYERHRLGRSAEAWMLRPEYATLFSDEERDIARRRLEAYGFDVERYLSDDWCRATQTLEDYDQAAAERVFDVIAPALPPGPAKPVESIVAAERPRRPRHIRAIDPDDAVGRSPRPIRRHSEIATPPNDGDTPPWHHRHQVTRPTA